MITRGFSLGETYQVSDLAKRRLDVVARARRGGALIRDKDGLALMLSPADDVVRNERLIAIAGDFLRLLDKSANPTSFGSLSWLTVFDEDGRRAFLNELRVPLIVALSGGPTVPVEELLSDWQATAETWSDEALRDELMRPLTRPLHDIEL